MLIGRVIGWTLIFMSNIVASGEAVLALGTGSYDGLATREVWTLLAGDPGVTVRVGDTSSQILAALLDWPAWTVVGSIGLTLAVACRPHKRRRHGFRERSFG
jgi:hypothetical protein